jgi:hypothetical protein
MSFYKPTHACNSEHSKEFLFYTSKSTKIRRYLLGLVSFNLSRLGTIVFLRECSFLDQIFCLQ